MRKSVLAVFDIEGTLPESKDGQNKELYQSLFSVLNEIGKKRVADEVLFTLSSTADKEKVLEKLNDLIPYMEGTIITPSIQYSGTEGFDVFGNPVSEYPKNTPKTDLLKQQVGFLEAEDHQVSDVIFTDDLGEMYPFNNFHDAYKGIETTVICPEYPEPLPFEDIIQGLQEKVASLEKADMPKI